MADGEISYQSATRDVIVSASKTIGSSCIDANLVFTKCKAQHSDPEVCLKLGEAVLECSTSVLRKIHTKCPKEFEEYRKCMDKKQMNYGQCRRQEKAFTGAFDA